MPLAIFPVDLGCPQGSRLGIQVVDKKALSQYLLRKNALQSGVQCVFVEPQYGNKDAQVIADILNLPIISIDPQGMTQTLIDDGYEQFMQRIVAQFKACFS